MSVWKFRMLPLSAAVIMFLAAGCGTVNNASLSAVSEPDEPDITVAAIPTVDLAGLNIAQHEGLFARHGLHVRIERIPSSQAIITDQLRGEVDISAGSYVGYVSAEAAGARFRILAEASTLRPDTRVLVTAATSRITTIAALVGRKIGVNGTNSIGTLLISALLQEHGISPRQVRFVTDPGGFPAMPGQLRDGSWSAAFLAEPYVTMAGEDYGEVELADLDQGATADFPIDGYVATQSWASTHPSTAAAFVAAIEEGQVLAATDPAAVQRAMSESDMLPPRVTGVMSLPGFPVGPVDATRMQRTAEAMLQFGILGRQYTAEVEQGTLIRSMVGPG
jgi:NitT/TauT family transport system substrate-binding protein